MISDGLLIFLKYAGSMIAAAYGVYATLSDFKEEKDGKKVLSPKGYIGIALLLTSSVFALSTAGLKDYKDAKDAAQRAKQDAAKRAEDIQRIENVLAGLGQVKNQLGEQSTQVGKTQSSMEQSLGLTARVSGGLGVQLALSHRLSSDLGAATSMLVESATKTDAILRESTENIGFVDVRIELGVDPAALKNEKGESLVPEKILKEFREDQVNIDEVIEILQANYYLVRERVLRDLKCVSAFAKQPNVIQLMGAPLERKEMDYFFGPDRLVNFTISNDSETPSRVYCFVTYRSLPNRYSGIRRFKDLNGLYWGVYVISDLRLEIANEVALDVGQEDWLNNANQIILAATPKTETKRHQVVGKLGHSPGDRDSYGELRIPSDFF